MRYTVNENEKYLSIHEADVSVTELVKLLSKYDGYKVQINVRVPDNSYQLVTDAGFPQWTSSEPTDPYKIICETEVAGSTDPCVCGKNKKKK
jgi:hypothetical protein